MKPPIKQPPILIRPADEVFLNTPTIDAARLALYDEHVRATQDTLITSYTQAITSPGDAVAAVARFGRVWFSELLAPPDVKMAIAAALVDVILPLGSDIDVGFLQALARGDSDTVNSVLLPIRV